MKMAIATPQGIQAGSSQDRRVQKSSPQQMSSRPGYYSWRKTEMNMKTGLQIPKKQASGRGGSKPEINSADPLSRCRITEKQVPVNTDRT